jgi:hypothetical protein
MNSISQTTQQMDAISKKTSCFFQRYHVGQILRSANACKLKGFSAILVFLQLVSIIFENRSLYMQRSIHPDSVPFGKDTAYRFLNSCHTNWRRFTLSLAARIIHDTIRPLTDATRRCAIIVDDSLFSRARSKRVELLARVFDHVTHKYTKGFRLLVIGWSDGNTFLPLTFCLLSTAKEKNRLNVASSFVDARSNGGKQRKLAQMEAPAVVLSLLQEVKTAGIPAHHVLFDTWFCSPSSLKAIHDLGYDVAAMAKKTSKVRYLCNGKFLNVKEIYRTNKKRRGRSRYLLSVEAVATRKGESLVPVRLVFVRNRNNRKQYLVLVTTDLSLSEEEVIQLYGKRWGIEVFFKACKSYLRLVKDCRSVSYDAMTAHVAIVCTRYMLLAVEERENTDGRSLGELFYLSLDEVPDLKYLEALQLVLQEFAEHLQAEYPMENRLVQSLVERFLKDLPALWMSILQGQKCA